jgi:phosphocarrier protein
VKVARHGREMAGKSIMGILLLAAARGSIITISADGADEQAAIEALVGLVASGFGEDACNV